jgi:hypothetical protein
MSLFHGGGYKSVFRRVHEQGYIKGQSMPKLFAGFYQYNEASGCSAKKQGYVWEKQFGSVMEQAKGTENTPVAYVPHAKRYKDMW